MQVRATTTPDCDANSASHGQTHSGGLKRLIIRGKVTFYVCPFWYEWAESCGSCVLAYRFTRPPVLKMGNGLVALVWRRRKN